MPVLALFTPRACVRAGAGFLIGSLILPCCALALYGIFRAVPDPAMQRYGGFVLLPLIVASAVISIAGFFWTLGQLSVWSAQGSRLAQNCMRIWIGTAIAMFVADFILGRTLNPFGLLPIVLLILLRPKPDGPAWSWPLISLLERQEPRPLRWGICVAIGFQIMSAVLNPAKLNTSPYAASTPTSPLRIIVESFAALAMGFVLGALMQAWTKQRWPVRSSAILFLLATGLAFALRSRIPGWIHIAPEPEAVIWCVGLWIGDAAAAREQSEPLPAGTPV